MKKKPLLVLLNAGILAVVGAAFSTVSQPPPSPAGRRRGAGSRNTNANDANANCLHYSPPTSTVSWQDNMRGASSVSSSSSSSSSSSFPRVMTQQPLFQQRRSSRTGSRGVCHHSPSLRSSSSSSSSWSSSLHSTVVSTNEDLLPGIAALDEANDAIAQRMHNLRQSPYFRLFCVDILASCEYMPQELFECYSELCEVYPVDDDVVPGAIRNVDLVEGDFEIDGWARWDMPSNDYYDTEEFPEGYTGYDGSEVWNFIHNKICFDGYGYDGNHWKADFNKAVSGLHSVVSAQVTRGIQDKIDAGEDFTADEVWRDPKVEFDRRLAATGETKLAMENLYFAYMLFLSAAAKAKEKLLADCASGKIDSESAAILEDFLSLPILASPDVEAAPKKLNIHALESANNLWEARMRSRDLLRVMNCVQCNKCRLHGKVAMMGLSTALQIHLGRTGEGGDPTRIHRVELAALMSTIYKFSQAVEFCQRMRVL